MDHTTGSDRSSSTTDQASREARDRLHDTAEDTRRRIEEAANTAREKGREAGARAGQEVRSAVEQRRGTMADKATHMADAFRDAANSFRQKDEAVLARTGEGIAERLDRVSDYLRRKDTGEMLSDAERVARHNVALFLGGAFVIGTVLGRFLRASRREERDTGAETRGELTDYGTESGYGTETRYGDEYGGEGAYGATDAPSSATMTAAGSSAAGYPGPETTREAAAERAARQDTGESRGGA